MADSPYAAIKIADFRLLLASRLIVTVAMQIMSVSVGWQIYALTKDPLSLGLIGLAEAFPAIGISLYAGHVADIIDRRLIALGAVLVLILSLLLLAVCSAGGVNKELLVGAIYVGMALSGFGRGFYGPAVFGILSDIVPRELYGNAIAWNTMLWQASAILGTILGGLLYICFSAASTYFICTALLAISFCCFFFIKSRTLIVERKESVSVAENIKEGFAIRIFARTSFSSDGFRSLCGFVWRRCGFIAHLYC